MSDVVEYYMMEEPQPTCETNDWNCMLENFYKGYLVFVEAVVSEGICGEEGEECIKVYGVDVTGLSNDDINDVIEKIKVIYSDAMEVRVHFCGNHMGKPCRMIKV